MTRRDILKITASAAVASVTPIIGSRPAAAEQKMQPESSWRFIFVNDLHYMEPACRPWFDKTVAAIKASAPDARFCLLGGDLTDSGTPDQMANIHAAFQALGIPVYATPGNHDHVTDTDRSAYEKHFPGHTNLIFEHAGWRIMGLDTTDGTLYANTKIHQSTLDWVDKQLPNLDPAKPTIVWTHFPLGTEVTYRPLNADDLLNRLAGLNIHAILSGHFHGFTERKWKNTICTTDKCCSRVRNNHDGTTEKGWFVVTIRDGQLSREFVELPAFN